MTITLNFHPPNGLGHIGVGQHLTEAELCLIPNIGDEVTIGGVRFEITRKCFTFTPTIESVQIDFATDVA